MNIRSLTAATLAAACLLMAPVGLSATPTPAPSSTAVSASSAPAASAPSVERSCRRSKKGGCEFYEMGGSLVDGLRFKPSIIPINVERRVEFGRLLNLKKPQFFKLSFATAKLALFR